MYNPYNVDFSKYLRRACIEFVGVSADVSTMKDEMIGYEPICAKNVDFLRYTHFVSTPEYYGYEESFKNDLREWFYVGGNDNDNFEPYIYDDFICFSVLENADGIQDSEGAYLVDYTMKVLINGAQVCHNDLVSLFPSLDDNT